VARSEGEECCLALGDSQLQGHPWQPAAFPLGAAGRVSPQLG